ncbi:sulfite exporter TauE/SafE family protein [Solidesulfovibrio sp.]|uniref:sulfite exporter TauE/SafE family protein n=1 Tax=Solidesulfovibrio sp. TaxID=2910990 RepID=UPI000ED31A0D|nr:sulfite exporter TauE/SafE family protein [Solidesulfovibrio sp.]MEA5090996.1 sulfite exporter TauE/SafE family protein [Solidesulfovibrio sp.]HCR12905.1 sulfite exporter TauE/SafE family protein [Desulfovibrio sp.]HML59902.1 sulfite exporter TauE/SafE family protein [Solidesulfovibrio sp.]
MSPAILHDFGFILLGLGVGAYGTLIGAGGGFVLMPVLLLLYPQDTPSLLTSISLAVVFFNAASGAQAYARLGRIDYRSGLAFAAAAVPGAVLGALSSNFVPRRLFDGIFGVMLIAGALFLILRRKAPDAPARDAPGLTHRRIVEHGGAVHEYAFRLRTGVVISLFVGYLSSFLGIGGGIIHVPALVYILSFPVHVATATSHFILAIMALAGTLTHVFTGEFVHGVHRTIYLALGAMVGAQVGALLSNRIKGRGIITSLAVALIFVGARILVQAF